MDISLGDSNPTKNTYWNLESLSKTKCLPK